MQVFWTAYAIRNMHYALRNTLYFRQGQIYDYNDSHKCYTEAAFSVGGWYETRSGPVQRR